VLDLTGADPEGQRAEGAVGRGVRVAADDRHSWLGDAQLGADHVHDALPRRADRIEGDPELAAVSLQRLHLDPRQLVANLPRCRRAVGGHVVIGGGERSVWAAHRTSGQPQGLEGLRRRDLVHEVQVDVQQAVRDLVSVPDLVEQRLGDGRQLLRRPAATIA
jgi:hypothetical protein